MSTALPLHLIAATGTAAVALIGATPALAQEMGYEERVYEYAQPAPQGEPETVFVREEVVQAVPEAAPAAPAMQQHEVEHVQGPASTAPAAPPHHGATMHAHPAPPAYAPQHQHHGHAAAPAPHGHAMPSHAYPPMPPVIDRKAWIAECQAYLRERRRQADRGAVAGGLLGAAAGGVIGNRVADGERLGGTLIGAGVGGLVGLFIGQAIALAGGDGTRRDCKSWLRTYEDSYANGGYWPGRGQVWQPYPRGWSGWGPGGWNGAWNTGWNTGWHGGWGWQGAGWHQAWGWSGAYVVVPQTTVVVHHQAWVPVVRETVREEWVTEKVHHAKPKHHHHHKPAPKVRYIKKAKGKPVKYIKGK